MSDFPPGEAAARERLDRVDPVAYARSRNHLTGAVSRLSPYITHGVLSVPEVWAAVRERHRIDLTHRFAMELGWREFFHHAWRHEGDRILTSLHPGPLPDTAYSQALPLDILEARTGIPVIDRAVQELRTTGWLHNHARMWFASYWVHVRKIHWRVGADWMFGHLLDGDLASNHLSWQWVAGTGSSKPYLFNAENVARFAPIDWHSPGSVNDTTYERLDQLARTPASSPGGTAWDASARIGSPSALEAADPDLCSMPPFSIDRADPVDLEGAWMIHPWALAAPASGRRGIGVFVADFHRRWPWSERRWRFVFDSMRRLTDRIVWCEAPPPATADTVANPHLGDWLRPGQGQPVPRLFADPDRRCRSFSAYWRQVGPDR